MSRWAIQESLMGEVEQNVGKDEQKVGEGEQMLEREQKFLL